MCLFTPTSLGSRTGYVWWLLGLMGPCWNTSKHTRKSFFHWLAIETSLLGLNRERVTFYDCWDFWDYVELCRNACGRVPFRKTFAKNLFWKNARDCWKNSARFYEQSQQNLYRMQSVYESTGHLERVATLKHHNQRKGIELLKIVS